MAYLSHKTVVTVGNTNRDHVWLVVDRTIVHLQQGNVVFIGKLVEASVGHNFLDLPVDVSMGFIGVQYMVLSHSDEKIAGRDILKAILITSSSLYDHLDTVSGCDDPTVGEQGRTAFVFELAALVLP